MTSIPDPAEPEYFLDSFPRDAFPAYVWIDCPTGPAGRGLDHPDVSCVALGATLRTPPLQLAPVHDASPAAHASSTDAAAATGLRGSVW